MQKLFAGNYLKTSPKLGVSTSTFRHLPYRKLICFRFALNDLVSKKSDKINSFVRQQDYSLNDLIHVDNFTLPGTDTYDDIVYFILYK